MEFKTFKMTEFKALDEPGKFQGEAAWFSNKDLGRDVIEPGSFTKTIKDKDGKFPFIDNHDSYSGTSKRLGIVRVEEAPKALKVTEGKLIMTKKEGQDAYEDMKFYQAEDMPLGMSIGYDAVKSDYITEKDGSVTRHIKEIALWEVSLVTFPMNPKARVRNVKGLGLGFKQLLDDIKAGVLSPEELLELKAEFKELSALLSEGAAIDKPSSPQKHEKELVLNADWLFNKN
jgi:hypothetical protein